MYEEEKGYGKPPKKHQFKKGVSGNPRGRPKGKKSFAALFKKLENEKITIQINGRTEKLTVYVKQWKNYKWNCYTNWDHSFC